MAKLYRRTVLLMVLALPLAALPRPNLADTPALPLVIAYSLDKVKVTLPNDLAGQQDVLVLYFQPDQSQAAAAWSKSLLAVKSTHPGLQSYIMPVYSRENFLYRWWIEAALRSGALSGQDWRSTIPLFVDKAAFLRALGIASEKQSVVLLTNRSGHVRWRADGPFDETKLSALSAAAGAGAGASGTGGR